MSVGKQFEKDLLASFRSWGYWAERFRDNTFGAGKVGSHASPPDMIVVANGTPCLIECKAVTTGMTGSKEPVARPLIKGAISNKRCEGHQLERLLEFDGTHGIGLVAVCFYTPRAQKRCAVLIPVQAWVAAPDLYGRSTLRLSDLRDTLPPQRHLKWVGRKAERGPYEVVTHLTPDPTTDLTGRS